MCEETLILGTISEQAVVKIALNEVPSSLLRVPVKGQELYVARTRVKGSGLFPSYLILEKKKRSGPLSPHGGEECTCVLDGEITYYFRLGNKKYINYPMKRGDVIQFRASVPHYIKNTGDKQACLLIVRSIYK